MRVLVTGITGFAGRHLARALACQSGVELHGSSRSAEIPALREILVGPENFHICDLAQAERVERVIRSVNPEQIYHLAGYANAGLSFRERRAAWEGNLTGTLNLLDVVGTITPGARLLFVGSGLIYGEPDPPGVPQSESAVLRPTSPYATSKAAADLACYQTGRERGLDVVRARPFNHIGPGQSPQFAIAHFAQQIAEIEAGKRPAVLETGSLEAKRDLTDVRDVAEAYVLLMQKGRKGEAYNIGTGTAVSMQSVVDGLCAQARVNVTVRTKESLLRPNDTPIIEADAGKIDKEVGWRPARMLVQTLADTLDYWRERVNR